MLLNKSGWFICFKIINFKLITPKILTGDAGLLVATSLTFFKTLFYFYLFMLNWLKLVILDKKKI